MFFYFNFKFEKKKKKKRDPIKTLLSPSCIGRRQSLSLSFSFSLASIFLFLPHLRPSPEQAPPTADWLHPLAKLNYSALKPLGATQHHPTRWCGHACTTCVKLKIFMAFERLQLAIVTAVLSTCKFVSASSSTWYLPFLTKMTGKLVHILVQSELCVYIQAKQSLILRYRCWIHTRNVKFFEMTYIFLRFCNIPKITLFEAKLLIKVCLILRARPTGIWN